MAETVDLPVAIDPVRPIISIVGDVVCYCLRSCLEKLAGFSAYTFATGRMERLLIEVPQDEVDERGRRAASTVYLGRRP